MADDFEDEKNFVFFANKKNCPFSQHSRYQTWKKFLEENKPRYENNFNFDINFCNIQDQYYPSKGWRKCHFRKYYCHFNDSLSDLEEKEEDEEEGVVDSSLAKRGDQIQTNFKKCHFS